MTKEQIPAQTQRRLSPQERFKQLQQEERIPEPPKPEPATNTANEKDDFSTAYLQKRKQDEISEIDRARDEIALERSSAQPAQKPVPRTIEKAKDPKEEGSGIGITEIPKQIVGGLRDAAQEVIEGTASLGNWLNENVVDLGSFQVTDPKTGEFDPEFVTSEEAKTTEGIILPEVGQPKTLLGSATRGISQFVGGFIPVLKGLKGVQATTKAAQAGKLAAAGAITDFSVFDPHAERLSNLIQDVPILQNPVNEFLAAQPDDTELEGRLKNALEGLGIEAALGGAFIGATKAIRSAKKLRDKPIKELQEAGVESVKQAKKVKAETEKPAIDITGKEKADLFTDQNIEDVPLGINLKGKPGEKAFNINLARVESSDDIKRVLEETAKNFSSEIKTATRGVQPNKLTEELADDLGLSVGDLLNRKKGEAFNAEQAVAARKILISSAENLRNLATKVQSAEATDVDRLLLRKAVSTHGAIQQQVSGLTAEAGRALQSFNILAKSQREQIIGVRQFLEGQGGRGTADDLARGILESPDDAALNRLTKEAYNASSGDMVYEAWVNSILSGPTTHMVNIASNFTNALLQIPERAVSSLFSKLLKTKDGTSMGEAMSLGYGFSRGIRDGWSMAKEAFKNEGLTDPLTKAEGIDRRAITSGNLSKTFLGRNIVDPSLKIMGAKTLSDEGVASNFVDAIGSAVRFPGFRMLNSEDAFFKGLNYRMNVHAESYRQALSEGLQGKELASRVEELTRNPSESIRITAREQANVNTFTNYNKFSSSLNAFRSIPGVRYIIPFVNTPSNIMRFAYHRTPFALLWGQAKEDILAGGAKRDMALGKIATGSMAMAYATNLALDGRVTGAAPDDPALRKIWLQNNQEYSFVFDGDNGKRTFVSYNRFEPIGMLFGFSADYANIVNDMGDKEASELIGAATMAFGRNVLSKTWLKSISDMFSALDNPDRSLGQFSLNLASGLVPNAINQTNRAFIDPVLRETRGFQEGDFASRSLAEMTDAAKAKIPGYSKDLPARRNLWGEPIEPRAGFTDTVGQRVYNLLSPAYVKQVEGDKVNEVILDNDVSITMPKRSLKLPGVPSPVELTSEQYSRYVELAGVPTKQQLDELVNTATFDSLSNGENGEKARVIRRVVSQNRQAAKAQLLEEFPDIIDRGVLIFEQENNF